MASYKKLDSFDSFFFGGEGGGSISSSLEDDVASAILFTQGFLFSWGGGGRPPREGKSPRNEAEATQTLNPNPIHVMNYQVHLIPIQRVKI